jgi:hypothetical protein
MSKRKHPEMQEGPSAFVAFRDAVKRILSVRKSDLPLDPFKKSHCKKMKPVAAKG